MKATGIVRRIDDLGRVVIPKEIRRTMRIREGDSLEIYTNNQGEVIFKKYSSIGEVLTNAVIFAETLNKFIKHPVIITDTDNVIFATGNQKREFMDRRVSTQTEEIILSRKPVFDNEVQPIESLDNKALAIVPIVSINDCLGSLIVLDDGKGGDKIDETLLAITAEFLSRQVED
ncbi:MAG: stage V sporulation T C-terminal domain-containing protein [Oscillospiraceae bacterium]